MAFLDKAGLEHLWAQIMNQLNTKEDLDSKTTVISETSTNDQYPGAKAVYDFVNANIPDTSTFAKITDLTGYAKTNDLETGAIVPQYSATCGTAVEAENATKDGSGNVITTTYATKTQLSDGSVTKIGTSTVGSSTKPIYLNAGVPTAGTYTLGAACAKSVSDSSSASALSSTDTNVPTVRDIYYGLPKFNNKHDYASNTNFYAPTVDTGGRWLRGTGLGEPKWALPINIQDSYNEISSNKTVPDLGVGLTGVICYFTSKSSTYTIYLPSSGEWAFAYQISNSYYNGAVEQVSSAKSIAWRNSAASGGSAMCSIKGNGKYTSIMIIYTRTK